MKPIATVILCHFNLIINIKTIGLEHTEHWRFEDNCYEIILPRRLVTVHDFYCAPVIIKIWTVKPTLNTDPNNRRFACAFELVNRSKEHTPAEEWADKTFKCNAERDVTSLSEKLRAKKKRGSCYWGRTLYSYFSVEEYHPWLSLLSTDVHLPPIWSEYLAFLAHISLSQWRVLPLGQTPVSQMCKERERKEKRRDGKVRAQIYQQVLMGAVYFPKLPPVVLQV